MTGTIGVTSNRQFTIAGYVNSSHGRVTTSVSQQQNFSSTQTIDFDTVNQSVLNQQTSVQTSVSSNTTVSSDEGTVSTIENFSFPITVNTIFPVATARFGFTVDTRQKYHTDREIWYGSFPAYFNSLTNSVAGSDVSPASSSQKYSYFDSEGQFYNCRIASGNDTLTKVSEGCNPDEH